MVFYSITGLALLVSLIADRKKTLRAGRVALKKLLAILPAFLMMLIFVTIALYAIPETMTSAYLGNENAAIGFSAALILGSLTLMPGFIAFSLCGILLTKGVSYIILGAYLERGGYRMSDYGKKTVSD